MPKKRIGVLTGGGDCPGLNPAIRGIVMRAQDFDYEVVGIRNGWKGLLENQTQPLTLEDVEEIISKGGTILGTSRTNPFKKENGKERVLENMKKLGLDALIAIGGEDTLGVASKFAEEGMRVVGIPKTMDNDLSCTDYTFGFDTSVTVAMDAADKLRDTAKSHQRVMVLEVMGRHAGWVALFTGLACGADWILLPEDGEVDLEKMCSHLLETRKRGKTYNIVVISEGIKLPQTDQRKEELDDFGHMLLKEREVGKAIVKEIEKRTGLETRLAVIGHIQRGGPPTLFDRILGLRTGVKAVELIEQENYGRMACLVGNRIESVPLKDAVAQLKTVDNGWMEFSKIFFK
jgi:6-phosphofructokinase 1